MTEWQFQVAKSVGFVVALLVAVGLQRARPHRRLRGSWRANIGLWAINAALLGIVCGGCACVASLWARENGIGVLNALGAWPVVAVLVGIVGLDLVSYVWHRANHRVSFLWRFHQAHHSDSQFTVTTALRFHPGELLLALPVRLVAVVVLGVPVVGVIVFEVVFAFANFVEHGNIDLPRRMEQAVGRVLITPALHRRHHGRESRWLDSNYGTIFSVWDRLLRTFGDSGSDVVVETGLPGIEASLGPAGILALPVRGVFRGR